MYLAPVAVFVRVTEAPGIAAPDWSVTTPVMPETSCAQTGREVKAKNARVQQNSAKTLFRLNNRINFPPMFRWTGTPLGNPLGPLNASAFPCASGPIHIENGSQKLETASAKATYTEN